MTISYPVRFATSIFSRIRKSLIISTIYLRKNLAHRFAPPQTGPQRTVSKNRNPSKSCQLQSSIIFASELARFLIFRFFAGRSGCGFDPITRRVRNISQLNLLDAQTVVKLRKEKYCAV